VSAHKQSAGDTDRKNHNLQISAIPHGVSDDRLRTKNPSFYCRMQCVEEMVLNVLVAGQTMVGRDDHISPGFPVERLPQLLAL